MEMINDYTDTNARELSNDLNREIWSIVQDYIITGDTVDVTSQSFERAVGLAASEDLHIKRQCNDIKSMYRPLYWAEITSQKGLLAQLVFMLMAEENTENKKKISKLIISTLTRNVVLHYRETLMEIIKERYAGDYKEDFLNNYEGMKFKDYLPEA